MLLSSDESPPQTSSAMLTLNRLNTATEALDISGGGGGRAASVVNLDDDGDDDDASPAGDLSEELKSAFDAVVAGADVEHVE